MLVFDVREPLDVAPAVAWERLFRDWVARER